MSDIEADEGEELERLRKLEKAVHYYLDRFRAAMDGKESPDGMTHHLESVAKAAGRSIVGRSLS